MINEAFYTLMEASLTTPIPAYFAQGYTYLLMAVASPTADCCHSK
jgi:hypothetical protein